MGLLVALVLLSYPIAPPAAAARTLPEAARAISPATLLLHVKVLASEEFEGRGAGSEGDALARTWLGARFREIGLEPPAGRGFLLPFRAPGLRLADVVGLLPGRDPLLRDEVVVIGAHFDHLGRRGGATFPGADDNASGCAALVEIARAAARHGPARRTILFCGFDGEEAGLLGSRHFVESPPIGRGRIVCMLNMDMVSRGAPDEVRVCGTPTSRVLADAVAGYAEAAGLRVFHDHEREWRRASDHGPFGDAGIPFLYFGVLDHEDYHRPTDTPDRIDPEKLARIARLVCAVLFAVADGEETPRWEGDV